MRAANKLQVIGEKTIERRRSHTSNFTTFPLSGLQAGEIGRNQSAVKPPLDASTCILVAYLNAAVTLEVTYVQWRENELHLIRADLCASVLGICTKR